MEHVDDGAMEDSFFHEEPDERDIRAIQHGPRHEATPRDGSVMEYDNPPVGRTVQRRSSREWMDEWLSRPSYREWMDSIDANRKAVQKNKVRVANATRLYRGMGLAWMDPEYMDSYALEAGIEPAVLREVLHTDEGARMGVASEARLKASGEAQQVLMAKSMPGLIAAVEKGLALGGLPEATAIKLIDLFSKDRGQIKASDAQSMLPPPMFTGTAAELIAEITAAGAEAQVLADFDPGKSKMDSY